MKNIVWQNLSGYVNQPSGIIQLYPTQESRTTIGAQVNNLNSFLLIMIFHLQHCFYLIFLKCMMYTASLQWTRGHQCVCVSHTQHTSQTSPTRSVAQVEELPPAHWDEENKIIIIEKNKTFTHIGRHVKTHFPSVARLDVPEDHHRQEKNTKETKSAKKLSERCWSEAWGTKINQPGVKWSQHNNRRIEELRGDLSLFFFFLQSSPTRDSHYLSMSWWEHLW